MSELFTIIYQLFSSSSFNTHSEHKHQIIRYFLIVELNSVVPDAWLNDTFPSGRTALLGTRRRQCRQVKIDNTSQQICIMQIDPLIYANYVSKNSWCKSNTILHKRQWEFGRGGWHAKSPFIFLWWNLEVWHYESGLWKVNQRPWREKYIHI